MEEKLSPMLKQYRDLKEKYKGCILFFRLGDFYEMFFEDAIMVSKELEITLTSRACGLEERAPMCGVPFHSASGYIARLVEKGYKVAICEQMEDPKATKNLVERDVIRIVTPGTITDLDLLDGTTNNYLCVIYAEETDIGLVFCDISTGEVYVTHVEATKGKEALFNEIARYVPSECIVNQRAMQLFGAAIKETFTQSVYVCQEDFTGGFTVENGKGLIREIFKEDCLSNVMDSPVLVCAVYTALDYLLETQKTALSFMDTLSYYETEEYMQMDMTARRNLELVSTMRENEKRGSLLWVLDKTKTNMGARLLKTWIEKPLINPPLISRRSFAVSEFSKNMTGREEIRAVLSGVYDIARLITRISLGSATPRDLLSLKTSICELTTLKTLLQPYKGELLKNLFCRFDTLGDIFELLERAICEDAPVTIKDGGIIKEGYNDKIDEYKHAMTDAASIIAGIEATEREKTDIKTLKIGYNRVFGYYIEVSRGNVKNVPETYIRKQTLTNGERYITPELKEIENTIMSAKEKRIILEETLYAEILENLRGEINRLKNMADVLATIDVLCSFSKVAQERNYVCPVVDMSDEMAISDGRHPVVEMMLKNELFVPNDTNLNQKSRLAIITGPNMAGKSTYMRQVALIALMAQIGSFVPASYAKIGVVDKIFTRVGASDDLSTGQSTFMVEMNEVAHILKNATSKSLLILDEIGRGTSTYDGLSIAWAVTEYIEKKIKAKTLFATHYHELTELEDQYDDIENFSVAVKKRGDDITFLRKIIHGGADDSYGVEVALLAGIPKDVVNRAKQILKTLEEGSSHENKTLPKKSEDNVSLPMEQMAADALIDEIKKVEVLTLSPLEAQAKLNELINRARNL